LNTQKNRDPGPFSFNALNLLPVLIRLVFDCSTTLLNIFASAFNRIATGNCSGSAGQE